VIVTVGTLVNPDPPPETAIALTPTLAEPTAATDPLPVKVTEGTPV
jgi:hypothetical protein